ncbi:MAG TPA: exopolyphosphatase [Actinomycetaceae bacterium]|nr:exopolyphosphatase [Actinomycetaceae bacterium]
MRRVGAIDCGTNSVRLLIAEAAGRGQLREIHREMRIVRLGQGVDRTGRIDPVALARTFDVVSQYAATCREAGVEQVRMVATSATRDAANRADFIAGIERILGSAPDIISGDDEAALSFTGAATAVAGEPRPLLVVDIGGGSTELVTGAATPTAAASLDIGSVRLTERHFTADPPTPAQITAASADIDAALDAAAGQLTLGCTRTVVGVAGSITTVTAHALGLASYDRDAVNGAELPAESIHASCAALLAAPRAAREAMGFLHPGRIDVIAAGALIWSRILTRVAQAMAGAGRPLGGVFTSEHDILDGLALSLLTTHPDPAS